MGAVLMAAARPPSRGPLSGGWLPAARGVGEGGEAALGSPSASAQLRGPGCTEWASRVGALGRKACQPGLPGRVPNPKLGRLSPPWVHSASVTQEPRAELTSVFQEGKTLVIFQL